MPGEGRESDTEGAVGDLGAIDVVEPVVGVGDFGGADVVKLVVVVVVVVVETPGVDETLDETGAGATGYKHEN